MQSDISHLIKINGDLMHAVNTIESQLHTFKTRALPTDECDLDSEDEDCDDLPEPSGCLVLGDCIMKNVKSMSDDVKINCIEKARFCDLKKSVKLVNPKKQKYSDIYIICGTNDASTKKSAEKIIKDCVSLLESAKERAVNVHLSSILPRTDEKAERNKIDNLNQMLITVTNNQEITFINNDKNFRYRDDSIVESMLSSDGWHLSRLGADKLLLNLGLQDKLLPDFGTLSHQRPPAST